MNKAKTTIRQVHLPYADLRSQASADAGLETQVLHGETVNVIGREGEWLHIESTLDQYVGYMRELDLSPIIQSSTHKIRLPRGVVYGQPSYNSRLGFELNMNSRISVRETRETPEGLMLKCSLGWIYADQVMGVHQYEKDFVAVALLFLETPYGWGWRSSFIDCSALLQHACILTGTLCPRNSGQQATTLGRQVPFPEEGESYLRGDLIFWTEGEGRHVVIMVDGVNCVHATNAEKIRRVVLQPLSEVIEYKKRKNGSLPTVCRRLPNYCFG